MLHATRRSEEQWSLLQQKVTRAPGDCVANGAMRTAPAAFSDGGGDTFTVTYSLGAVTRCSSAGTATAGARPVNTEHASWRLQFRLAYAEKRASEFQTFVHRLFELAFPGDFTPVAPAGSEGDRKCDGLLPSQQRLFQVYAPKQFRETQLLRKFKQDYEGAVEHWADQIRIWTFVHNSREVSLSMHVTSCVNPLHRVFPLIFVRSGDIALS